MARAPLAALLLAAVAVAGCGASTTSEDTSDRFQGQQRLVANTVENLQGAAEDSDQNKICRDIVSRSLNQRLSRQRPCPVTVKPWLSQAECMPARQCAQVLSLWQKGTTTKSPGRKELTSPPTSSTTPTHSCPIVEPGSMSFSPR